MFETEIRLIKLLKGSLALDPALRKLLPAWNMSEKQGVFHICYYSLWLSDLLSKIKGFVFFKSFITLCL